VSSADPNVIWHLIDDHFRTLRAHPRYERCQFRVWIENNLSNTDANRVSNQLEIGALEPIEVVRASKDPTQAGFVTTNKFKHACAEEMVRSMALIQRAREFVCATPDATLAALYKQVGAYRKDLVNGKWVLTGKSPGTPDDLAIVYQMTLYFMYHSLADDAFTERMSKMGASFG
jgi:hypothetical protein